MRIDIGGGEPQQPEFTRRRMFRASLGAVALAVPGSRLARAQDAATPEVTASPSIRVFPIAGSLAASPGTQITFRGVLPETLGPIHVTGAASGEHSGTLIRHSDGRGASWFPDFAFRPGEVVSVRTRLDIAGGDAGDFQFTCVEPRASRAVRDDYPAGTDQETIEFRSRPGLKPPPVAVEVYGGSPAPGYLFLSPKRGGGRNGALIVDDQGEPVWFFPVEQLAEEIFDFRVMEYQDQPVLVWWQGIAVAGHGYGHWVIRDRAYEEIATIRIGNGFAGGDIHDIVVTPAGTAIVGAYNTVRWDLTAVGGERDGNVVDSVIQEIDIATGAVLYEWHSLDHIALDESYKVIDPENAGGDHDYFHFNSVAIDADENLIVNARNTWAAYKLDRESGDVLWRLGGKVSDVLMGENTEMAYGHDARRLPSGELSFFDNGAAPKVHDQSRGVIVALDVDTMEATLVQEYVHPDGIVSSSQGNMQVLPNGNVVIGWGSEPLASEFAPDGSLLLDARLPMEKESYRAYRFEWAAQPADTPAIAVEAGADDAMVVYASWNGATEVSAWRVVSGDSEGDLAAVSEVVPRSGFETAVELSSVGRLVAVEAIDADGETLSRSRVVDARA